MKLREISDDLFYVGFLKRKRMGAVFMRFYAHYENPRFQGKVFTQKQFERWFKNNTEEGRNLDAKFSKLVGGFDIPSYVFSPFFEGKFDPLSREEKELLNEVDKIGKQDFFVISSLFKEKQNKQHEIVHGLYYLNEDYKIEINEFLKNINKKDYVEFEQKMRDQEIYAEFKIVDEVQANLISYYEFFLNKNYSNWDCLPKYNKKITSIFDKYWKNKY